MDIQKKRNRLVEILIFHMLTNVYQKFGCSISANSLTFKIPFLLEIVLHQNCAAPL